MNKNPSVMNASWHGERCKIKIRLPVGPVPSVVVSQLKSDWYSSVDNDHDENLALVAPSVRLSSSPDPQSPRLKISCSRAHGYHHCPHIYAQSWCDDSVANTRCRIDGGYSGIGNKGFSSNSEDVTVPASYPGNLRWDIFFEKALLYESTHFMQSLQANSLDSTVDLLPPFDKDFCSSNDRGKK